MPFLASRGDRGSPPPAPGRGARDLVGGTVLEGPAVEQVLQLECRSQASRHLGQPAEPQSRPGWGPTGWHGLLCRCWAGALLGLSPPPRGPSQCGQLQGTLGQDPKVLLAVGICACLHPRGVFIYGVMLSGTQSLAPRDTQAAGQLRGSYPGPGLASLRS